MSELYGIARGERDYRPPGSFAQAAQERIFPQVSASRPHPDAATSRPRAASSAPSFFAAPRGPPGSLPQQQQQPQRHRSRYRVGVMNQNYSFSDSQDTYNPDDDPYPMNAFEQMQENARSQFYMQGRPASHLRESTDAYRGSRMNQWARNGAVVTDQIPEPPFDDDDDDPNKKKRAMMEWGARGFLVLIAAIELIVLCVDHFKGGWVRSGEGAAIFFLVLGTVTLSLFTWLPRPKLGWVGDCMTFWCVLLNLIMAIVLSVNVLAQRGPRSATFRNMPAVDPKYWERVIAVAALQWVYTMSWAPLAVFGLDMMPWAVFKRWKSNKDSMAQMQRDLEAGLADGQRPPTNKEYKAWCQQKLSADKAAAKRAVPAPLFQQPGRDYDPRVQTPPPAMAYTRSAPGNIQRRTMAARAAAAGGRPLSAGVQADGSMDGHWGSGVNDVRMFDSAGAGSDGDHEYGDAAAAAAAARSRSRSRGRQSRSRSRH